MAVIREAPDFALRDVQGKSIRLSELKGKTVLVAFIYTTCTGACPLLSARMSRLQQMLEKARIPAALVSVSVEVELMGVPRWKRGSPGGTRSRPPPGLPR